MSRVLSTKYLQEGNRYFSRCNKRIARSIIRLQKFLKRLLFEYWFYFLLQARKPCLKVAKSRVRIMSSFFA
jgi:hypothetical protein